ncbi:MAG: SIR2 family protein [Anaerolineales bacterium]
MPFIGAGFSKNASLPSHLSMPDWPELARILAKDAGTAPATPPIVVAQRYEQRFGRVQLIEAVREALHSDKARPGKAHRAFVQLPFDTIYTTNFDLLLEDAYLDATRPFRSLVGEPQLAFHAGQTASSIIKMHGDLRHEEHIVITEDDYRSFIGKYPAIATHLSAMLITRTPLFIGYSLSDPDFENIRKVIRERLGVFERMAYVIQFDVPQERIEDALASKLHIISIDSSATESRDQALANFFEEIQKQLDTKSAVNLRSSRPDLFEEMETDVTQKVSLSASPSPIIETTSRLCFVMMPFSEKFNDVYRLLIAPAVEHSGLTPLRADEMVGGGFIIEQIRTAIHQSRLCIADVTGVNANVLWEVGYAVGTNKPLILIAEEESRVPFNIAHLRRVVYGNDFEVARLTLQRTILAVLSHDRLQQASELLNLGQYRGAIAAGAVVLEHSLRQTLAKRGIENSSRMSMGQILQRVHRHKILKASLAPRIREVMTIRNRAVHEIEEPTLDQATFVLSTITQIVSALPDQEV